MELILINQLFSSNLNIGLTGFKRTFTVFDILAPCIKLHKNDWVTPFLRIMKSQFWKFYWRRWWCLWGWRWCNKHRGNDPSQCDTCSIGPRGDNSSIVVTRDTIHYCLVYTECARQSKIVIMLFIMLFISIFFIKHPLVATHQVLLGTCYHCLSTSNDIM